MRARTLAVSQICVASVLPGGAEASERTFEFAVPAGQLGDVAIAIGARAGVTVVIGDPILAGRPSRGVHGRMSVQAALARALKGLEAEAVSFGPSVIRIRRLPGPPPIRSSDKPSLPPELVEGVDIVVTASKQALTAMRYPGTIRIVEPDDGWLADNAGQGTSALAALSPSLGSTNLGNGRNKLFVRGIADSSFNGPTQSTTGHFLGDVRLTYNAPDPDLAPYDLERFEVLVGPQGTLYGAGSLGGIVRLVPRTPETSAFSGSMSAGLGGTARGGTSADAAVTVNLPLVRDRAAVRVVAYGAHSAGYIDAPRAGRRNINDRSTWGQRIAIRLEDLGGWTVDAGVVVQNISAGDGQYVLRDDPALTRDSAFAQPFNNRYRMGYLSGSRDIGPLRLTSVTSLTRQMLTSVFDTSEQPAAQVARYTEDNAISLLTHETRVTGGAADHPWVAGIAAVVSRNAMTVALRPPGEPPRGGDMINDDLETAVFGQASLPLHGALAATLGARVTYAYGTRSFAADVEPSSRLPPREDLRLSGTIGLVWSIARSASAYYSFQHGYRPGGMGLTLVDEGLTTRRFLADDLLIHEIGFRWRGITRAGGSLSGEMAIFQANWRNIQADLVGDFPVPHTSNVGNGIIRGIDLKVEWRASDAFKAAASFFVNDSDLQNEGAVARSGPLPNVAGGGGRLDVVCSHSFDNGTRLSLDASLRYVGQSRLGIEPLDFRQGDYATMDMTLRVAIAGLQLSLGVTNLGNSGANTFAYGNPFGLGSGNQITPLRPRSYRMGVTRTF